jgi:hypothetical protein
MTVFTTINIPLNLVKGCEPINNEKLQTGNSKFDTTHYGELFAFLKELKICILDALLVTHELDLQAKQKTDLHNPLGHEIISFPFFSIRYISISWPDD